MASYTVPAGDIGAYEKTLTASTVDTVTFTGTDVAELDIVTDGTAAIYVRFDGTNPTVGGTPCHLVPAVAGVWSYAPRTAGATVVKLISTGTPKYSVAKVV